MDHPHRPRLALTAALGLGLAVVGAVTACGGTPASGATTGVITVVAAENMWGDITSQIGGSHVAVTSIITDPNADPHTYESTRTTPRRSPRPTFVIENGAGYDDFMDKILSTTSDSNRDVLSLAQSVGATGATPTHTSGTTRAT